MSADCRQRVPGLGRTSEDAGGRGWAYDLRGRTSHDRPRVSRTFHRQACLRESRQVLEKPAGSMVVDAREPLVDDASVPAVRCAV